MTALTTSPFLTLPPGIASLTVATMVSPIPAYRRPEPPRTRMHRISLAPVLSATRSRDSCWITFLSPKRRAGSLLDPSGGRAWPNRELLGLLEDLHQAPALGGAERAGLHDEDAVADSGGVGLVVRLDLAGAADDLAVEGVLDAVLDLDDNGLVHLVAHHVALAGLAVVALTRLVAHGLLLLAHASASCALSAFLAFFSALSAFSGLSALSALSAFLSALAFFSAFSSTWGAAGAER